MIEPEPTSAGARRWHVPMSGRNPDEEHRASTPLELLFDLCFVVAVSQAGAALHHDLAAGNVGHAIVSYLTVFFAIWWPWVNFTWFASAYDTDDVLYRLLTFVNIVGVLVVTAGIPRAFASMDFSVMLVGYVIMRISLVAQWFRVSREDPYRRTTALRFAWCIAALQLIWVLQSPLPQPWGYVAFLALVVCELLVPVYAESSGRPTPWNPEHVSERYGLFTLIVIGEVILASTTAVQAAATDSGLTGPLLLIAAGGLLLVFSLWWMYFKQSAALGAHASLRQGIAWGYGHYVIFAALAALGAGLQTAVDSTTDAALLTAFGAAAVVAVPTAAYLMATGVLHGRGRVRILIRTSAPTAILVVLVAATAPVIGVAAAVVGMGLVTSGMIAQHVLAEQRASSAAVVATGEHVPEAALATTDGPR